MEFPGLREGAIAVAQYGFDGAAPVIDSDRIITSCIDNGPYRVLRQHAGDELAEPARAADKGRCTSDDSFDAY
jgi:hypothetical protein